MNLEGLLQQAIDYGQSNTTLVMVAAATLVLLTIFKTKPMMKLYGVCIIALVGLYLLSLLSGALFSGSEQKNRMIYKTREAAGE